MPLCRRGPAPGAWPQFLARSPVLDGRDGHPCFYVLFDSPYDDLSAEMRERGWRVAHLRGAHLHQIVDSARTRRHLVETRHHDLIYFRYTSWRRKTAAPPKISWNSKPRREDG